MQSDSLQFGLRPLLNVVAAIFLAATLYSAWLDLRVRTWPTTVAHIEDVEIKNDSIGLTGARLNTPMRQRRFHVRYTYSVAGHAYLGTRVGPHDDEAQVSGNRSRFAVGQTIAVHYNAANPTDAVIVAPFPVAAVAGICFGLLVLATAWRMAPVRARRAPAQVMLPGDH